MSTSPARAVFVLGKEIRGNREAVIVEAGEEYTIDVAAIVDYQNATATFPYSV